MGPDQPEGKVRTMLGVQLVGDRDSLKTLTPAQHGTSTYGRARKKVGLTSELYFPVKERRAALSEALPGLAGPFR